MDKIFLHGMKAQTLIGVYEWERLNLQTIILDLDITLPARDAQDDDIAHTIHYGEVCHTLREHLREQQFQLIERLAQYIADFILTRFAAERVRVRVIKQGILPDVREVGVEIERQAATVK